MKKQKITIYISVPEGRRPYSQDSEREVIEPQGCQCHGDVDSCAGDSKKPYCALLHFFSDIGYPVSSISSEIIE